MTYDIYVVGDSLRAIRNKLGYTQNDMAEKLDVSYIHYSQIEQGRHRMSLELMMKIVSEFGIEPNALLGIDNSKKENAFCEIESRIKMFNPKEQEYLTSACLIFIDGYEARREVV